MATPEKHAESSAKRWGGNIDDYISLHALLDSSKQSFPDNRHRAIFHHIFGCYIMEKMFGVDWDSLEKLRKKYKLPKAFIKDALKFKEDCLHKGKTIMNASGRKVSVKDIAELHVLEDMRMRFIPSMQDYLQFMDMKSWMQNGFGNPPPSYQKKIQTKIKD